MYFDLKDMVRQLIRIIYKHNIQTCKTEKQLITIDLFSQKNLISVETISLCFNVENNLRKMRRHDVVSRSKITQYTEEELSLVFMLSELFEKCPVESSALRFSCVLDL